VATKSLAQVAERLGLSLTGARYVIDRAGLGERVGGRRVVSELDLAALELARRTRGSLATCRLLVMREQAEELARRAEAL
jgi:hypothetical protein